MSDQSSQTPSNDVTPATPPPSVPDQSIPQRDPQGNLLEPKPTSEQTSTPTPTPEPKPADAKSGAPEAYTAFTAPEGYTLDQATIDAATPIFKDLGLTQAQAQSLVDFHSKQMIDAAKAPAAAYEATRTTWKAEVDADPDIKAATLDGKTGLDAVKIGIAKTLNAIGDPKLTADFKAAMDLTGAGDNPAFIKAMWKLSSLITEGKHVAGAAPSPHGQKPPGTDKPSAAKAMYPNLS